MTPATTNPDVYDPHHPWISGPDEDPSKADWAKEFMDPSGTTKKPVFLRGQSLLGITRLAVIVASLYFSGETFVSDSPLWGIGIFFLGMTLLLILSMVSHVRRLRDAGKTPLLALIIAIPFILSATLGVLTVMSIPGKVEAYEAKIAGSVNSVPETDATEAATDEDGAEEAARRPPPEIHRETPITVKNQLAGVVGGSLGIWMLLSFFAMLFTLFYVARRPSIEHTSSRLVG